ncbi:MAG TPA: hypothetical protein VM054_07450 [bacterium]|nr:hypothetical protein [bacterium]
MINLAEALSWIPPEYRGRTLRPYYTPITTAAAIGVGGAADLTTPLQNVAAFLLMEIVGRVYTVAAPDVSVPDPSLTAWVRFSSGDDLTNGAMPWAAIIGSLTNPNAGSGGLVAPRLVSGGSIITVSAASYGATAYLVRLSFGGINIFNT